MLANEVFFSFTEVLDPSRHQDYNEWHQLDHRPENLALPGVLQGERWVRTPDCAAAAGPGIPAVAGSQYVNLYWFAEPVDESIKEWQGLAERSFQWGRRPEGSYTRRPLMGFFRTVKGYAAPRVLVSPDALPFRPNRGIIMVVHRMLDPHSLESEEMLAWYDRVHIPDVLAVPGVAGAYTFSSRATTLDPEFLAREGDTTFTPSGASPGYLRATLIFVDDDPVVVAGRMAEHRPIWEAAGTTRDNSRVTESVFTSPLRTIVPWQWDWFAGDAAAEPR